MPRVADRARRASRQDAEHVRIDFIEQTVGIVERRSPVDDLGGAEPQVAHLHT
jgi:hypothetical protein